MSVSLAFEALPDLVLRIESSSCVISPLNAHIISDGVVCFFGARHKDDHRLCWCIGVSELLC